MLSRLFRHFFASLLLVFPVYVMRRPTACRIGKHKRSTGVFTENTDDKKVFANDSTPAARGACACVFVVQNKTLEDLARIHEAFKQFVKQFRGVMSGAMQGMFCCRLWSNPSLLFQPPDPVPPRRKCWTLTRLPLATGGWRPMPSKRVLPTTPLPLPLPFSASSPLSHSPISELPKHVASPFFLSWWSLLQSKGLVDRIMTSDEYIRSKMKSPLAAAAAAEGDKQADPQQPSPSKHESSRAHADLAQNPKHSLFFDCVAAGNDVILVKPGRKRKTILDFFQQRFGVGGEDGFLFGPLVCFAQFIFTSRPVCLPGCLEWVGLGGVGACLCVQSQHGSQTDSDSV